MAEPLIIEWHPSATPGYLDCARKQFASAHRKELLALGFDLAPDTSSVSASMGRSVHKLAQNMLRIKQQTGDLTVYDIDEVLEQTFEHFEKEIEGDVVWDKTTPRPDTAREQLHAMARAMVPTCQLIDPFRIEEKYEHIVSPLGEQAAVQVKLSGTIDVLDTRRGLWDHKTGARFPKAHAQQGCYLILLVLGDEQADSATLNYIPRLGITKLDQIVAHPIRLDVQECIDAAWTAIREIQRHYEDWLVSLDQVKAGKRAMPDAWTIPANPNTQNCTPKYCSAFDTNFCRIGAACKGQ